MNHRATYYVAAMASFAVITACYNNIAIGITFQRDSGVLKRTNGTRCLPSGSLLGARMLHALLIALLLVAITRGVRPRRSTSADMPTGAHAGAVPGHARRRRGQLLRARARRSPRSSRTPTPRPPIVNAIDPAAAVPVRRSSSRSATTPAAWIAWTARIFPVKHFADGMQAGFLGSPFHWTDVRVVVAAWGWPGWRWPSGSFSWEPR